ncbi:MAG: restriction endonuclease subunit R [Pelagibacterium sp. SCN 63-23]|nr:MAG: restriction endonuclease subunit R [Pelagibacterium sp. SCN 63-23]
MSDDLRHLRSIAQRLSLRAPQEESLRILSRLVEAVEFSKELDPNAALAEIQKLYPSVEEFVHGFPSLCFAIATGVGKTRLMGAFIAFLFLTGRSKNFFILAPNTTIYDKLVADFSRPAAPKYVFRGIALFAQTPPTIITGENWEHMAAQVDLFGHQGEAAINIFNVQKLLEKGRVRALRETIGESYFDYLSARPDLVLLMDEAHRYRASAGMKAISELKPILGLELTATPKSVGAKSQAFRNVVFEYRLGDAMKDGFVKEPAVATRANFRRADYDEDALETIMLEDAVHYHEQVRTELELYARNTGRSRVHPFVLVVAQDTRHASDIKARIQSDDFFSGAYRDLVIEVHSALKGDDSEEAVARLVGLETDAKTEIVIHVNKLKEGWDVTNLFTIVPLRASASDILTEQTLGRGLRLPYGERTGVEAVDTLTVIAHDRFDAVIQEARKADSVVQMKQLTIGPNGDVPDTTSRVVEIRPAYEMALTGQGMNDRDGQASYVFDRPEDRQAAAIAIDFISSFERQMPGGVADFAKPEVQQRIADGVRRAMQTDQATFQVMGPDTDVEKIVEVVTKSLAENLIEIPEIVVIPSREVTFWFEDFDLTNLDHIRFQPISDTILIRNIRLETQREMARAVTGTREARTENYIVRHLIDDSRVDYDDQAEQLYRWAGQMLDHLRGYLADEDAVENVAMLKGRELAAEVLSQMGRHYRETPTDYRAKVVRQFRTLRAQSVSDIGLPRLPITQQASPLSATGRHIFVGGNKSPFKQHRFHSDPERHFAAMIDSDFEKNVLKWLKPGRNEFSIEYHSGKTYEPDFVVETIDEKLIVEIKSDAEMTDPIVLEKARAAGAWVGHANQLASEGSGKPWAYMLVPGSALTESATLAGLRALYGR